jgi:hypothetical protein
MYTVAWRDSALDELARLWMQAPDRNRVRAASDEIDTLLARDPLAEGESRIGTRRILFVLPLGVTYDVDEAGQAVHVLAVWRVARTR